MCSVPGVILLALCLRHIHIRFKYLPIIVRIFQEKPLFIIPRGEPWPEAEEVRFKSLDGLALVGCYLKTPNRRRGVILFGLEFGSNCWSSRSYCEHLVENGFDVFAFETRNQGASDCLPGYDPLQWVTEYEVSDTQAALAYLKSRPDADPRGIGFFGISRGAGAGLAAASRDRYIRCVITDGAFATYSTLVPYMRHWFRIYNTQHTLQGLLPSWYFGLMAR
jgi:predicted alpha/beta hydrolase